MIVHQLAEKLNIKAINENFNIAQLPELRKQFLGKKILPHKIFTSKTVFEKDKYAFHHGGREELQFNFGEEIFNKKKYTRFGLCISLESSPSLGEPLDVLGPYQVKFNQCLEDHPEFFGDFKMWYYYDGIRSDFHNPQRISDAWFKSDSFIVLGSVINKTLNELNENDLNNILKGFDRLLPIYEYCVLNNSNIARIKDKRIMRITWNANNWEFPSGHPWHKKNQGNTNIAYENQYGYGHEEWLFNERYRIDGFQYGYIRGVDRLSEYEEFLDEIVLFTIREDKQRCLIGILRDVEIIEGYEEELKKVTNLYKKYHQITLDELKKVNADCDYFKTDIFVPNVKFKWQDAQIFNIPIPISFLDGDKFNRFQPYKLTESIDQLLRNKLVENAKLIFKSGKASATSNYEKTTNKSKTIVKRSHSLITEDLYSYLLYSNEYKEEQLSCELTSVGGAIVDFAILENDSYSIFEVKTSVIGLKNIRQALGQLFEYAFLDESVSINRLVIVGPALLGEKELKFLGRIKAIINTPLEYWAYLREEKEIERKFFKQ